jgi:hypothetical protein
LSSFPIPLHVGEVLSAIVRRKLSSNRVLISLKGRTLVAEPERDVAPGEEIPVQVLATAPRIRLRVMSQTAMANAARRA